MTTSSQMTTTSTEAHTIIAGIFARALFAVLPDDASRCLLSLWQGLGFRAKI